MDENAQKLLMQYGLSNRESAVYLHLLAYGGQGAGEIAKALQIRRMEAYRVIKKLAEQGIVVASPGKPVKYSPEPIEDIIAKMMDVQMGKLQEMEKGRSELVTFGRSLRKQAEPGGEYRFKMIQGREQIYSQIQRMIDSVTSRLDMVLTRNDLVQLYLLGMADKVRQAARKGVETQLISSIDFQTVEAIEGLLKACGIRHSDEFLMGRLVIADGKQILVSLVLDDTQGRKNERDVAIWTDSKTYADMMRPMFEKAFSAGQQAEEKVREVKSGRKGEERTKAIVDVIRATLPLDGWQVESPGRLRGLSGNVYEFNAVLTQKDRAFAVQVVLGTNEATARDSIIAAMMRGLEVKSAQLFVIAAPYDEVELGKLARLVGVTLINGSDTVDAVTRLRGHIT